MNYAYTNHLPVSVLDRTFGERLASLLPCYWICLEAGHELKKGGSKDPDYQRWIDNHAGTEYERSVKEVLAMTDAEAGRVSPAQRESARRLFGLSARYEYLFWDMAWREEQWLP